MNVLIVYGTSEGHTRKLARYILELVRKQGWQAHLADAADLYRSVDLSGYDALIVGASVHYGDHSDAVVHFVRDHAAALEQLPSAFFSVSLSAVLDDEHQAEARAYVEHFFATSGWRPQAHLVVAGALLNSKDDYYRRELARYIVQRTVGEADPNHDHDYTDYDALSAFVTDFLQSLSAQTAGG